jgi:hypothetical protein
MYLTELTGEIQHVIIEQGLLCNTACVCCQVYLVFVGAAVLLTRRLVHTTNKCISMFTSYAHSHHIDGSSVSSKQVALSQPSQHWQLAVTAAQIYDCP